MSLQSPAKRQNVQVRMMERFAPAVTVLGMLRPHVWLLLLGILVTLVRYATTLGSVMIGAYVVGQAVTGARLSDFQNWLIVLAALVIGRGIAYWLEMWLLHDVAYRILADLRLRLYERLELLAPAYMIEHRTGDIVSTAMSDIEECERFYAHTINVLIAATVACVAALIIVALLHPAVALALLAFVLLGAFFPLVLHRRASRKGRQLREQVGNVNAEVVGAVQGLREITLFGQEASFLKHITLLSSSLNQMQMEYGRIRGLETAVIYAVRAAAVLTVLGLTTYLVDSGSIDRALFPLVVVTAFYIFEPLQELTQTTQNLGQTFASFSRVLSVYFSEPHVQDRPDVQDDLVPEPVVQFESVSFRYNPDTFRALDHVSFDIHPGETVALVGHSGAGKSTCANLLMRFWDVEDGAIRIGGVDVRDLSQQRLRDLVAYVPQDIFLFNWSIAENLRLGKPDATDQEVIGTAETALADEFIRGFVDGYQTHAGERGLQMSGGQRQRLAIARALLKDAPILIMDEAVSNLDAESEEALKVAFDRVRANRTTMIIAHRLSTIRTADRIVVLDQGRVAEIGTHQELLARDGVYTSLVSNQQHGMLGDAELKA